MNHKTTSLGFLLSVFTVLLLSSCLNKVAKFDGSGDVIVYPPPPDTARIQFLAKISSSADVTGVQTLFSKVIFGQNEEAFTFNKPYGAAMKNGKLFVCDSPLRGLEVIDFENNAFDFFVPKGLGELQLPLNCDVDNAGNIYVADASRMQIVVFNEKGTYLSSFGETENFKPTDVQVQNNKIWVVNLEGHNICVYSNDSAKKLLYSFPESDEGLEDYLYSPTNFYVSGDKVYVSDMGDFKIKVYSHDGTFIKAIGSPGLGLGQFVRPKGLAVDRDSNIYVVDASFENVQIFNSKGQFLMPFGGHYEGPGDMFLPSTVIIDYDNVNYFKPLVDPRFEMKYLIIVINQYGPDKVNIYGYVEPAGSGTSPKK